MGHRIDFKRVLAGYFNFFDDRYWLTPLKSPMDYEYFNEIHQLFHIKTAAHSKAKTPLITKQYLPTITDMPTIKENIFLDLFHNIT